MLIDLIGRMDRLLTAALSIRLARSRAKSVIRMSGGISLARLHATGLGGDPRASAAQLLALACPPNSSARRSARGTLIPRARAPSLTNTASYAALSPQSISTRLVPQNSWRSFAILAASSPSHDMQDHGNFPAASHSISRSFASALDPRAAAARSKASRSQTQSDVLVVSSALAMASPVAWSGRSRHSTVLADRLFYKRAAARRVYHGASIRGGDRPPEGAAGAGYPE